jgi:adenine phosphoribosyltransferase
MTMSDDPGLSALRNGIRDIPDFPRPGVVFKDITPLLADGGAFRATVERFVERYRGRVDTVLGIESRGFIIGAAVAYGLGTGLALVRKPGKLPHQTYAARYELEYGSDVLEIHHDAFAGNHRVLVIDDLLATGGTASAAVELVRRCGGKVVACGFVIELDFLGGRQRLAGHEVFSLLHYDRP